MTLDLDPDRQLALAYVPKDRRLAVESLWRLDVTFAAVLATGRDPMVSGIRLAWWREALEKLDEAPAPAEPVLQNVARHLVPAGLSGAELAAMEAGWSVLLTPHRLTAEDLAAHASERGGRLFRLSGQLLGEAKGAVEAAGEAWALIDLARHSRDESDTCAAIAAALARTLPVQWPMSLRPLGMLAILARRDARDGPARWERPGSPRRMGRMLLHRLTGR